MSGGKERKLVCAARRAGQRPKWRDAALGYFDDALGIGPGFSARADRVIIAGLSSSHAQLPASVTGQRVEKEDGAEDGLKEIDVMIPPLHVRQLVSQHRASLRRRRPGGDVGGEDDHRGRHAEQNRRADSVRKREASLPGARSLAAAFGPIKLCARSETSAGAQAT